MTDSKKKHLSEYSLSPEKENALLERIDFVEQYLALPDEEEKCELLQKYQEQFHCSARTLKNYLKRYAACDAVGLILYDRKRTLAPRQSTKLEDKIITLIKENPRRSIPRIRELLLKDEAFHEEVQHMSERHMYRIAHRHGLDSKGRSLLRDDLKRSYRSFEAAYSMALVQGDARDGIWLDTLDGKKRKTYLFLWMDDYSRKILYGQYYWDEKLPRMEDSFCKMVLRFGLPEKTYLDNGSVYISNHFRFVLHDLKVKQVHHLPYHAFSKGKIESGMKKIKDAFQDEAQHAGFRTLEELNSAFWAWADVYYDRQALSTTGEPPGERFIKGLTVTPRRIENLDEFMQYFLMRETRTITKYGRIKLAGNSYPVKQIQCGTVVHVRYDPFDLSKAYIYDDNGVLIEVTQPVTVRNTQAPSIPEETKQSTESIKESARNYFTRLRELHHESQKNEMPNLEYEKLKSKEKSDE